MGITRYIHRVMCSNGVESHDHLFFTCPMAEIVWQEVLALNNRTRPLVEVRNEIIWGLLVKKRYSLVDTIYKLSLASTVYCLWRERNSRIFRSCGVELLMLLLLLAK